MKLSDLINKKTTGSTGTTSEGVVYSWIKRGKDTSNTKALSFRFASDVLGSARYREGDRCDPDIDFEKGTITFPLGSQGLKLSGKSSTKTIGFSHDKAESDLSGFFPIKAGTIRLDVESVETGKIVCKMPQQQVTQ